jgi:ribA/ribD-fused uncharacterized protein
MKPGQIADAMGELLTTLKSGCEACYVSEGKTTTCGTCEQKVVRLARDLFVTNKGPLAEALTKFACIPMADLDGMHGLDNSKNVFFYEQEFYVLSNFSAFELEWNGISFNTVEHAYHWCKFKRDPGVQYRIQSARSAHDAYQIAQNNKAVRDPEWDRVKVQIMAQLLHAKVRQHEYVKRKLLETGDRQLVENSWRDSFWGWGEDRKGLNVLGKLWMSIREEIYTTTNL